MDTAKTQQSASQKQSHSRKTHHNVASRPWSSNTGPGYGLCGLCGNLDFHREKRAEISVPQPTIKHQKSVYPSHLKLLKEQAQRLTNALQAIENQIEEFSKLYPESVKD